MKIEKFFSLNINEHTHWVAIRGDSSKPILLVLHGGPGTPCMNLFRKWSSPLEEDFLVVTWDQRGTGRSYYKKMDKSTMTINQLVDDVHTLTNYLKQTYSKDKIYLMGHSFGATLGLKTVSLYPRDYLAYFGISQFVNTTKNESLCYDWVMEEAKKRKDAKAMNTLQTLGRPVDGFYKGGLKHTMKVKQLVGKYKGDSRSGSSTWAILLNMLVCPEYRGRHLSGALSGITYSLETLGNDLKGIDYTIQIPRLELPVYFFSGKYDQLTPQSLLKEYYEKLEAPQKNLFIFDKSAHNPLWEEKEKFHSIIHDLVSN